MTVAVRVSAVVTGHRRRGIREHDLILGLPPGKVTAHQVIEAAVRAEVAAYHSRAEEDSMVRVLTNKSLAEDLARGAVRSTAPEAGRPPVDTAAAVDAALLAFDDGLFKIFVGEDELTGDMAVPITDGAALLFLRLVALAGG